MVFMLLCVLYSSRLWDFGNNTNTNHINTLVSKYKYASTEMSHKLKTTGNINRVTKTWIRS